MALTVLGKMYGGETGYNNSISDEGYFDELSEDIILLVRPERFSFTFR